MHTNLVLQCRVWDTPAELENIRKKYFTWNEKCLMQSFKIQYKSNKNSKVISQRIIVVFSLLILAINTKYYLHTTQKKQTLHFPCSNYSANKILTLKAYILESFIHTNFNVIKHPKNVKEKYNVVQWENDKSS